MRSIFLVASATLMIPACVVGTGEIAGNGSLDNGNGPPNSGPPGGDEGGKSDVSATLDKTAVSTELGKVETLTITVAGTNGFSGLVDVSASVVDAAGASLAGWTVTPTPASVELATSGSAQVKLAMKVPSDAAVLSPKVKVALSPATGAGMELTVAVDVAKQITIDLPATGTAIPHAAWPAVGQTVTVRAGTKVVFHNADTIAHRIHGAGGILHEAGLLAPGGNYNVTPSANGQWWCHEHGEGSGAGRAIKVLPAAP